MDFSGTELETLQIEDFLRLTKLRELDLSYTRLNTFPLGFFKLFPQLEVLHLQSTFITQIDEDAFEGLSNSLEELNLSFNWYLQTIHGKALQKLTRLRRLNLAFNLNLVDLDKDIFYGLDDLQIVNSYGSKAFYLRRYLYKNLPSDVIIIAPNVMYNINEELHLEWSQANFNKYADYTDL